VLGPVEPVTTFQIKNDEGVLVPVLDAAKNGTYYAAVANDPEQCEYFMPIQWIETGRSFGLSAAVDEIGLFGNQNSVCRPTSPKWRSTVELLKHRFPKADNDGI
jgi:hypothetical protein